MDMNGAIGSIPTLLMVMEIGKHSPALLKRTCAPIQLVFKRYERIFPSINYFITLILKWASGASTRSKRVVIPAQISRFVSVVQNGRTANATRNISVGHPGKIETIRI